MFRIPQSESSDFPFEARTLAERHLGIIAKRCYYFWNLLPPAVRASYDVDDMVKDVVTHLLTREDKYDPRLARESTFVQRVADNKCKSILAKASKLKVLPRGGLINVEDAPERFCADRADATFEIGLAKDAVERVIEHGSDRVCDLVEFLLYGGTVELNAEAALELRETARKCGAGYEDFWIVRKYVLES